jgi:ubiquitin-associated SH3 domain-containing protein
MTVELIVYACPVGELADQLDGYFAVVRERFGRNTAHAFMPHVTLTGFFRDEPSSVRGYVEAVGRGIEAAGRPPTPVAVVTGVILEPGFHRLAVDAPWFESVVDRFRVEAAASPTRHDDIRPKRDLHLSLAYDFADEQHESLARLATELVDPRAPCGWTLHLFERSGAAWHSHAVWDCATLAR